MESLSPRKFVPTKVYTNKVVILKIWMLRTTSSLKSLSRMFKLFLKFSKPKHPVLSALSTHVTTWLPANSLFVTDVGINTFFYKEKKGAKITTCGIGFCYKEKKARNNNSVSHILTSIISLQISF